MENIPAPFYGRKLRNIYSLVLSVECSPQRAALMLTVFSAPDEDIIILFPRDK